MTTKDKTAAILVVLIGALLAVGVAFLLTSVFGPAIQAGIVIGGM